MYVNVFKKAMDLVNSCREGYVSVIDSNGYPHVATRSNIKPDGIVSLYFTTNLEGNFCQSVQKNPKASVCFREDNDNVTLMGSTHMVSDTQIKASLWQDWFINHYPLGIEDPNYVVLHFVTDQVSLWMDREVIKFNMNEVKEVTSRCGLMCNNCEWKAPNQCGGCIPTNGHPFYGVCPIATCAQEKGFLHCGQCPVMPCEQLEAYSCGDGEHCDRPKGARLEVLKLWARG